MEETNTFELFPNCFLISDTEPIQLWGEKQTEFSHIRIGYKSNESKEILGAIGLMVVNTTNLLASKLIVADAHQKQGIGSQLLDISYHVATKNGMRLVLYVDKDTPSTDTLSKFYEKRGFLKASSYQVLEWGLFFDPDKDIVFYKI